MEPAISIFLWKKLVYFPAMQNQCHLVAISETTQAEKKVQYLSKYLLLLAAQQAT